MKMRSALAEPCYAAEGLSSAAAPSIVDRAPAGRLFVAIATLSDMPGESDADSPAKTAPTRKPQRVRR